MIFFWKPREIVIEQPAPQVEPQVPKPQSPTRPRPKPQPAQPAVIEPENQQPVFRSLQPKPAQSVVAAENQPVFRTLQPKPAQSQSFAAYDHALGSIQGASGKPVEVWGGADDGLTIRLRDALKDALRSADFYLSSGNKPGTLLITLPSNVGSKQVGGRTQVLYTAEFASEGQNLGGSKGACWDDALAKCAAQIVKDAKTARNGVQ
jgi:hypothetical protein